mgnify:FL=1
MNKKGRFGTPTGVSPHPKKLPYGPIPFSYTFTFETDPNYSGDNWVAMTYDSAINSGSNGTTVQSYNQTVNGESGCIKWTHDSSLGPETEDLVLHASRDAFVGSQFPYGSFSSFPANPSDYSTYTVTWKYYISRQAPDEGDTAIDHESSKASVMLSAPFTPGRIEYTPTINQWTTESITRNTFPEMDAFPGLSIRHNSTSPDNTTGFLTTDGDFWAIQYITVTLTP